jgi:hypothetical protein
VKTVSGDLTIKPSISEVTAEPAAAGAQEREPMYEAPATEGADAERTEPMTPPVTARVRDLLERVARGELGVDEAAAQLDETRRS